MSEPRDKDGLTAGEVYHWQENALKRIAELEQENAAQREAIEEFLGLLTEYYWEADDPELTAVNRLRRLIGWRDQLPKAQEAELQADEAEGGAL